MAVKHGSVTLTTVLHGYNFGSKAVNGTTGSVGIVDANSGQSVYSATGSFTALGTVATNSAIYPTITPVTAYSGSITSVSGSTINWKLQGLSARTGVKGDVKYYYGSGTILTTVKHGSVTIK